MHEKFPRRQRVKACMLLSGGKDLIFGVSLHLHAYFEVFACKQRRPLQNYVDLLATCKNFKIRLVCLTASFLATGGFVKLFHKIP